MSVRSRIYGERITIEQVDEEAERILRAIVTPAEAYTLGVLLVKQAYSLGFHSDERPALAILPNDRVMWGSRTREDGQHETVCMACNHSWTTPHIWLRWPVRLKWSKEPTTTAWFGRHGWEVGSNTRGQRMFGWTLHLKQLKVCFGPSRAAKPTVKMCPNCKGVWWAPKTVAEAALATG